MPTAISGVYAIRNTRTQAAYVGSAINIDRRWRLHLSLLKRRRANRRLQCAWDLDGPAHFTLEILETLPPV